MSDCNCGVSCMEIQNQKAVLNNPWHVEIFVISENIVFLWNWVIHPMVSYAFNNSVTVKFGMIVWKRLYLLHILIMIMCLQAGWTLWWEWKSKTSLNMTLKKAVWCTNHKLNCPAMMLAYFGLQNPLLLTLNYKICFFLYTYVKSFPKLLPGNLVGGLCEKLWKCMLLNMPVPVAMRSKA
jgi:hypothetical protein